MPFTFTFALSQNQTFELRCNYGTRRLDTKTLSALIDFCEERYYSRRRDTIRQLQNIGRELYQWLDGKEGWLRKALEDKSEQTIYLDLIQTSEAQALNSETERVALGLAHLPWELLHNGTDFLLSQFQVLPVRSVYQRSYEAIGVQNRPLRLIFMATSPEDSRIPPLAFEREEVNILQATKEQPLVLVVEESGSVEELANLVKSYPEDYFDVFHLTGHGIIYTEKYFGSFLPLGKKINDNTPCFITEDKFGNVVLTTASDLSKAFKGRFPKIIFLSGCHTGQLANGGTVASMAQALIKGGASIVLGWARPVYDRTGIIAAQTIYQALATGTPIEEAVKSAQQQMIQEQCSDWHLLRIYRDTRTIDKLVTPLRTKGRDKIKFTAPEQEFLDENNIVKVASRSEFVGRRRALQRCLKALRETSDEVGVFIAGMGGLGKSSLAARLCTRVQTQRENFERVVLIGVVDEVGLLNKLSNKYERFGLGALLNQPNISLKGRLQNFFDAIETQHEKPLLLVLDDFEQNIPKANIEDGSLRMTQKVYEVLAAICAALEENQAESRLIVTCRYLKEDTLPPHRLHFESLAAMSQADINKICRELDEVTTEKACEQRIITIADGNPRLLKWLLDVVKQPNLAEDELLTKLEETQNEFRENILAQMLLNSLEDEEKKFLARLSVFRLPVTEEEIIRTLVLLKCDFQVAQYKDDCKEVLEKLVSLNLLESAINHSTFKASYRVPGILLDFIQHILSEKEWQEMRILAVEEIYKIYYKKDKEIKWDEALEVLRLGLLAKKDKAVITMTNTLAITLLNQSRYLETFQLCRRVLKNVEDHRILMNLAIAESFLGSQINAITNYQKALEICPKHDLNNKATILGNLARAFSEQGDEQQALQFYQQALETIKQINNTKLKASVFTNMAWSVAVEGNIKQALELSQESLEIKKRIGNLQDEGGTLADIACYLAQKGELEQAKIMWQQALEIAKYFNHPDGEACTLANMAYYTAQNGDVEKALELWQESLEIDECAGNIKGKVSSLWNMAFFLSKQGQVKASLELWYECLEIYQYFGDIKMEAITLVSMAKIADKINYKFTQLELYLQAAKIYELNHQYKDLINVLANIGIVQGEKGIVYLSQTIWLSLKIKAPVEETINLIAHLYKNVSSKDKIYILLAATAIYLYQNTDINSKCLSQSRKIIGWMISMLADNKYIDNKYKRTPKAFKAWFIQHRLNEPEYFIPLLNQRLEEIIGKRWLFDPLKF